LREKNDSNFSKPGRGIFSRVKMEKIIVFITKIFQTRIKSFIKIMRCVIQRSRKIFLAVVSKGVVFLKHWGLTALLGLLCCGCIGILFINWNAVQAPSWIATSLSIGCSGAISIVVGDLEKLKAKLRIILPIVLFLIFIPSALGCWVTLRPIRFLEEIDILTVIDRSSNKVLPEKTVRILGNLYPYMYKIRSLINEELSQSSDKNMDWFAKVRGIASSRELGEFLILDELGFLFKDSWKLRRIKKTKKLGSLSISRSSVPVENKRRNILTKQYLEKKFSSNAFIRKLSDGFQIYMPPGMTCDTLPLQRWDGDKDYAIIFEDNFVVLRIEPQSSYFRQVFNDHVESSEQLFVFGLVVQLEIVLKPMWVGTNATRERKEHWINPLLEYLKVTFAVPG